MRSPGEVTAEMTEMMAAWAPSVGTISAGAGRKPLRDIHRLPASNQCSGKFRV